jgi:hypothetical protein
MVLFLQCLVKSFYVQLWDLLIMNSNAFKNLLVMYFLDVNGFVIKLLKLFITTMTHSLLPRNLWKLGFVIAIKAHQNLFCMNGNNAYYRT